jgi:type II secretory pathway component PulF
MSDPAAPPKGVAGSPAVLIVAHVLCWGSLVAGVLVFVPRMKMVMADFGVDLPSGTIIALKIVDLLVNKLWVAAALAVAVGAIDAAILTSRDRGRPDEGRWWLLLWFLGVPLMLIAGLVWAIAIPLSTIDMRLTG